MKKYVSIIVATVIAFTALGQSIKESNFGKTKNGEPTKIFTLKNDNDVVVKITNYGAIITELHLPDRNGKFVDVVLGFDNIADYETLSDYFGAVVGRYGNRIANAKFKLFGKEYTLEQNNNGNTLHGGFVGFDRKVWKVAEATSNDTAAILKLELFSADGENGFPGNLKVVVTYTLDNKNQLTVNYKATTDKPTVCNLTQHSYFNLFGAGNGSILNHEVTINADKFTPVDKYLIPTGDLDDVEGTPFDFRRPKTVGSRIEEDNRQLKYGGGYDHNWVLNKGGNLSAMTFAVRVYEPISGRQMDIFTTEPGVQFYCGNFLKGQKGKAGKEYRYRYGMCFETQHFPDSPNQDAEDFPTTTLIPGQTYDTTTIFKFSVQ